MFKKFKKNTLLYQTRIKNARIKKYTFILLFFLLTSIYLIQEHLVFLVHIKNHALLPNYQPKTWLVFSKSSTESLEKNLIRGDLIVFKQKQETHLMKSLMRFPVFLMTLGFIDLNPSYLTTRRVLGLPGDRLAIKNKSIYINGKLFIPTNLMKFDDTRVLPKEISPRDNLDEIFIPMGQAFLLSDYWDYLSDSRNLGLIDVNQIQGIFWKVINPPNFNTSSN